MSVVCYSDHNHDIFSVGACTQCGSTEMEAVDAPRVREKLAAAVDDFIAEVGGQWVINPDPENSLSVDEVARLVSHRTAPERVYPT